MSIYEFIFALKETNSIVRQFEKITAKKSAKMREKQMLGP